MEKRGRWPSPRTVLTIDPASSSDTAPGSSFQKITDVFEDVRIAHLHDDIVQQIIESSDIIESFIDDEVSRDDSSASSSSYHSAGDARLQWSSSVLSILMIS